MLGRRQFIRSLVGGLAGLLSWRTAKAEQAKSESDLVAHVTHQRDPDCYYLVEVGVDAAGKIKKRFARLARGSIVFSDIFNSAARPTRNKIADDVRRGFLLPTVPDGYVRHSVYVLSSDNGRKLTWEVRDFQIVA